MSGHTIGDEPQLRRVLNELRRLISLAETATWSAAEAQRIVEALRVGVPPAGAAVGLTVGRGETLARVSQDLEDVRHGKSRLVFLTGDYGMGKTHTLRVLQEYAHQKHFASSLLELSPRECPLQDLGLVYRSLVRNLKTGSGRTGGPLESLLEQWAERVRTLGEQDREAALRPLRLLHRDFRHGLTTYFQDRHAKGSVSSHLVLEWMAGGKLSARERAAIGVSGSVSQENALTMLGSLISMLRMTGIRGVVVLLDEVDTTLSLEGLPGAQQAARNLNALMQSCGAFPYSYFIYSTPPSFFGRFDQLSGLILRPQKVVELGPLDRADLEALAVKIRDLHLCAYVWEKPSTLRDGEIRRLVDRLLEDGALRTSVRAFVRAVVEVLDGCQQGEGLTLRVVTKRLRSSHPPA